MRGWNVRVTYEQGDPVGEDQIGDVLEALEAHSAVASLRDRTATVALFVDTDTVMEAIDEALRLVTDATAGTAGFVVVGIEAKTEEALHAEIAEPLFPPLVGYAEIADMLGVSRQRVYQLVRGKNFPAPMIETRQGPLMLEAAVKNWIKKNRP